MNDAQLLKTGMVAHGVAATHAAPLATKGWDAADNTALKTLTDDLAAGLQNQSIEIGSRDNATENRVLKGNELYDLLANELCEAGKEYWRTLSEAKYNDYIIYDSPSQNTSTAGYTIEEFIVPANSSFQIELDVPVVPNLELYLLAVDGDIMVCTTNMPAVPCMVGSSYLLQEDVLFKDKFSALNLDLSKTHFQFTNNNSDNVVMKVGKKNP
jgi:hypothetical protein